MDLVKQFLSSDMRTIKKTFDNIKYRTDTALLDEYLNIISANKTSKISREILKNHTIILKHTNHTTKVLNDVYYISMKS